MGLFQPAQHPYIGTLRMFMPQGRSPYEVAGADDSDGVLILRNGDVVDVVSAWTRPYLPPTTPTLLYVRSLNTGRATHVIESELPLAVPDDGGIPVPFPTNR
jgi:hypothetical protein